MSSVSSMQTRSQKHSDKEDNCNMAEACDQSTVTNNEAIKDALKKKNKETDKDKGDKADIAQSQLKQQNKKAIKAKSLKNTTSDIESACHSDVSEPQEGTVAEKIDKINSNPSSPVKMPKASRNKHAKTKLANRTLVAKNGQLGMQDIPNLPASTQPRNWHDYDNKHDQADNSQEEDQSLDLKDILKQLNATVKKLDRRLEEMDDKHRTVDRKIDLMSTFQQQDAGRIMQLMEKVEEQDNRIQALIGTVVRQDQQIQTLTHQVNVAYANNTQKNLIINGLSETQNENCVHEVLHMFKHILKIDKAIPLKFAKRIGKGQSKPMLIRLANIRDKALVFQKMDNLKKANQGRERPIFITDQLPEAWAERKRFIHHMKSMNSKLPKDQQHKIQVQANKLLINDQPYEPPIKAPTVSEFLNLPPERKRIIKELHVVRGQQDLQQHSLFIGYAATISSSEEIDNLYFHVKLLNPEATHVMCAYKLSGSNFVDRQSMVDDGEYGGGRAILNLLNKSGAIDRAVFVVRYYGGIQLGTQRFKSIEKVAESALSQLEQFPTSEPRPMPTLQLHEIRQHAFNAIASNGSNPWHIPAAYTDDKEDEDEEVFSQSSEDEPEDRHSILTKQEENS